MKPLWKYTIGLVIEVIIKVLQTFIPGSDTIISGTGNKSVK